MKIKHKIMHTTFALFGAFKCVICGNRYWLEKHYTTMVGHNGVDICKHCAKNREEAEKLFIDWRDKPRNIPPPPPRSRIKSEFDLESKPVLPEPRIVLEGLLGSKEIK